MRYEIEKTLDHVLYLARRFKKEDVEQVIMMLLIELGIPTHYDGFDYLVKAVSIFCNDPTQMIVKGLYPAVARQYDRDMESTHIEQAIRGAIQFAWNKHDDDIWMLYFPPGKEGMKKPTNTEFVSRLAYAVELWKACREKYAEEVMK